MFTYQVTVIWQDGTASTELVEAKSKREAIEETFDTLDGVRDSIKYVHASRS